LQRSREAQVRYSPRPARNLAHSSIICRRNRVYEVLNRRRRLTLAMIQKLHAGLGIPAESLLRQTVPTPAAR
jgi:plasmid maintenance system antidote protein VapI